jgi:hypothetical protein
MATENATPTATAATKLKHHFCGVEFGNRFALLGIGELDVSDAKSKVQCLRYDSKQIQFAARECSTLLYKAAASGEHVDQTMGVTMGIQLLLGMARLFDETANELSESQL